MQTIDQGGILTVEDGPQAGASLLLQPGSTLVGSDLDSDVVVTDCLMAAAHFVVECGPAVVLRAVAADVRLHRGACLRPGEAHATVSSMRFTAGGTGFRLDAMQARVPAACPDWRSRLAAPAAIVVTAAALLVVQVPHGDTSVASRLPIDRVAPVQLAGALPSVPTSADLVEALSGRMVAAGLSGLRSGVGADGAVDVSGSLSPDQQAAWADIRHWFDGHYGGRAVLVDRAGLSAPTAPLSVAALHAGASPFVIDRSGHKLFPGSELPDGWRVDSIEPSRVLVRRGDQVLAVRF